MCFQQDKKNKKVLPSEREHEFTSKKCAEVDLGSYLLTHLLISYLLREFFVKFSNKEIMRTDFHCVYPHP